MTRALKICCFATAIVIATLLAAILIIYLTMLKPKQPKITTQEVTLKVFNGMLNPLHLKCHTRHKTVDNPNYGSFKYDNTTAYVTYHGTPAAEAEIEEDTIPARGKHDVSTNVLVNVDNLTNYYFQEDFASGCLNFTSSMTLHGLAKVLNFLKIKATAYSTCDISVYVLTQNASSVCRSKLIY
ncbi:UNVERIFIED_CONTAM: hypothetical protein Sangu_0904800 [Sesamum angustifolium]|uniref:Late embryogenesis abundant protein LEA-2 subgroup domain-containing protein n=1 Tax=Sesamum angustifolium TaxID=2727405 RepID=A0AAW2PAN5_9LAMI